MFRYVENCTSHIAAVIERVRERGGADAALDNDAQRVLLRGLSLLTRFVAEFESSSSSLSSPDEDGNAVGAPVKVVVKCVSENSFTLDVHANMSIGELRALMAKKWDNKPISLIRVICAGKELVDDRQTLRSLKLTSPSLITMHITKRQTVPASVDGASHSQQQQHQQHQQPQQHNMPRADALVGARRECQPSFIIAQPPHFGIVFSLLELGSRDAAVGECAWRLLSTLPTNQEFLARLRAVERDDAAADGAIRWHELLPTRAPLALLYALQIAHGLLAGDVALRPELGQRVAPQSSPADADVVVDAAAAAAAATLEAERSAHAAAAQRWRARFVERGGVAYLLDVLLQTDSAASDAKRRRCLSLLLRVVNSCLIRDDELPLSEAVARAERAGIVLGVVNNRDALDNSEVCRVARLALPLAQCGQQSVAPLARKLMQLVLTSCSAASASASSSSAAASVAVVQAKAVAPVDSTQAPPPPPPPPPPPLPLPTTSTSSTTTTTTPAMTTTTDDLAASRANDEDDSAREQQLVVGALALLAVLVVDTPTLVKQFFLF